MLIVPLALLVLLKEGLIQAGGANGQQSEAHHSATPLGQRGDKLQGKAQRKQAAGERQCLA